MMPPHDYELEADHPATNAQHDAIRQWLDEKMARMHGMESGIDQRSGWRLGHQYAVARTITNHLDEFLKVAAEARLLATLDLKELSGKYYHYQPAYYQPARRAEERIAWYWHEYIGARQMPMVPGGHQDWAGPFLTRHAAEEDARVHSGQREQPETRVVHVTNELTVNVCGRCGAMVWDAGGHQDWHDKGSP